MVALQWADALKVDLLMNPGQHLISENEIGKLFFPMNPKNPNVNKL